MLIISSMRKDDKHNMGYAYSVGSSPIGAAEAFRSRAALIRFIDEADLDIDKRTIPPEGEPFLRLSIKRSGMDWY